MIENEEWPLPLPQAAPLPLKEQLRLECEVMARHLISSGAPVPAQPIASLESLSRSAATCHELIEIHNRLARLVMPATPRGLLFLANEHARRSVFDFLGEVPLVRRLMAVACVSTMTLFGVSLSPLIGPGKDGFSLLDNSGYSLLLHLVFILSAASVGACFANLYRVKGYVKDSTFDPAYESSYWIRYIQGLLAGTLMALLLPIEPWLQEMKEDGSLLPHMGKPALALLGGFSSAAVYRILNGLATALEAIVSGDPREAASLQARLWEARMSHREAEVRLEMTEQRGPAHIAASGDRPGGGDS